MKIALCIDGSGAFNDGTYAKEMGRSFVHQIWDTASMDVAPKYWRGPDMTGLKPQANAGVTGAKAFIEYLSSLYNRGTSSQFEIYICGYSRGAMCAIYVANRIAQFNSIHKFSSKTSNFFKRNLGFSQDQVVDVKIKSLVLFDAVDSDLTMMGTLDSIPGIVEKCQHFVCKAPATGNRSRDEFNRLILTRDGSGGEKINVSYYECTHSAIGGIPGEGDNTKPIQSKMQAAKSGAANMALAAMGNPLMAGPILAGGVAAGLAQRAVDQTFFTSGISVDQDWKVYPGLCSEVNKVLATHGWGAKITPYSRSRGASGSW